MSTMLRMQVWRLYVLSDYNHQEEELGIVQDKANVVILCILTTNELLKTDGIHLELVFFLCV